MSVTVLGCCCSGSDSGNLHENFPQRVHHSFRQGSGSGREWVSSGEGHYQESPILQVYAVFERYHLFVEDQVGPQLGSFLVLDKGSYKIFVAFSEIVLKYRDHLHIRSSMSMTLVQLHFRSLTFSQAAIVAFFSSLGEVGLYSALLVLILFSLTSSSF